MANNFSGSATRRWDTMMLEEPKRQKKQKHITDALIEVVCTRDTDSVILS